MNAKPLLQLYRRILKNPAPLRAAFLALAIASIGGISQIQISLNLYQQRDDQIPSTLSLAENKKKFKEGLSSSFILAPKSKDARFTGKDLCALKRYVAKPRQGVQITSLLDLVTPRVEDGRLKYAPLIDPDCESAAPYDLRKAMAATPWVGVLTDREMRDIAFDVSFQNEATSSRWIEDYEAMAEGLKSVVPSGFKIQSVGRGASQWYYLRTVKADLWVHGLLVAGIACIFRLVFGTWLAGLIFAATLGMTAFLVIGLMGLAGSPIDVLSNGLFLMTAIAAAEDFIFLSSFQMKRAKSGRSAFMSLVLPSFWTSATTFLGFISLTLSPMLMLQRFGFWAALAALVEWAMVFLFLPALAGRGQGRLWRWVNPEHAVGARFIGALGRLSLPRTAGRILLGLVLLGIVGYQRVQINGSDRLFPAGHLLSESIDYAIQSRGWGAPMYVVFPSDVTPLQKSERIQSIRNLPSVEKILSHADVLSSLTVDLDLSTRQLVQSELSSTPVLRSFTSWDGTERAAVFLKGSDLLEIMKGVAALRAACGSQCEPVGELVVWSDISERVSRSMRESFAFSATLVTLTLLFLSRRFTLWIRSLLVLTSLWGPISLYAIIWLGKLPMDLISTMVGAVLVGVTGDNAIQFIFASRRRSLETGVDLRSYGSAIVAVVTIAGSLALCLLSIAPMQRLGLLISLGFALSFLGDLILLRANIQGSPLKLRHPKQTSNP